MESSGRKILVMKAVILAGGYGTRLGSLTKNTPKPLLKIGNKSVIEHIIDRLQIHGITTIIVKVHYLPDKLIKVLGDKVIYYYEPVLFSAGETLFHLKDWLAGEDFIVCNGDTLSEIDYTDMISHHKQNTISVFMDKNWRCGGVWVYPKDFFENKQMSVMPYIPNKPFFDIGTPERLEAARTHFEMGEVKI